MRRRTYLGLAGGAAVTALAGCIGGDGGGYDEWLQGIDDYDGEVDRTGRSEVTVAVGAGDDGLSFDPVAVRIDAGTTVVWEWTGKAGRHNVVHLDGAFESPYHDDAGATFERDFGRANTFRYVCEPHRDLGMKGGVRVVG